MKKLLVLFAVMAMVATTSVAQFKYGGGLTLGTDASVDGGMNLGLNLRGDYAFNEQWSVSPGFTFFLPSEEMGRKLTLWQLNADAHYKFYETDQFSFYGLAGLNFSNFSWKMDEQTYSAGGMTITTGGDYSDSEIGLDLGAGANFGSKFYGELKYDTAFEQLAISVGIYFGGN